MELYERLEELDADKAEARASRILHGLGFTPAMQRKKLKDFSGGWRMRVALARWVVQCLLPPGRMPVWSSSLKPHNSSKNLEQSSEALGTHIYLMLPSPLSF